MAIALASATVWNTSGVDRTFLCLKRVVRESENGRFYNALQTLRYYYGAFCLGEGYFPKDLLYLFN